MMRLDPARQDWMLDGKTLRLLEALPEARFVGGAVRNALLGLPISDIDLATPLLPEKVAEKLKAAHINVVPTGVEHGTVTAVVNGKPFEITTLRRDVETDGRRAVVAFTTDWKEDSERRDFTMNALYASGSGEIFDYHDGVADLENGRVRFVGDARQRIREDYLRILRLFRFHAWYGKGAVDAEALEAATELKSGIGQLSGERVQKELLRLLEAADPVPVLGIMAEAKILSEIFPETRGFAVLEKMIAHGVSDPVLRLAALLPRGNSFQIAARLKLSNAHMARLENVLNAEPMPVESNLARRILYRIGASAFADRVQFSQAEDGVDRDALLDLTVPPRFPLTGRDAMDAGLPQGPTLGRVLGDLEKAWIESDFAEDRKALLVRLKKAAQAQ
jgi:poly(A) polymerase